MNSVDLLGAKVSIRVRIGMTHPYIEKCSPLSLPETPAEACSQTSLVAKPFTARLIRRS